MNRQNADLLAPERLRKPDIIFDDPDDGHPGDASLIPELRAFMIDMRKEVLDLKCPGVSAPDAGKRMTDNLRPGIPSGRPTKNATTSAACPGLSSAFTMAQNWAPRDRGGTACALDISPSI